MGLLPVGLVVGLLAEWPTWSARAHWRTVLDLAVGWAFVAAGLIGWARRPANRVGPLLTTVGFVWFFENLAFTRNPVAFGIGVWLADVFSAVLIHLVLAFPSGRLSSFLERILVGTAYVVVVVLPLLRTLALDPSDHRGCGTNPGVVLARPCPTNALMVWRSRRLYDLWDTTYSGLAVLTTAVIAVVFVARWSQASAPARRVLTPVLATSGITAALFLLFHALTLWGAPIGKVDAAYWSSQLALGSVAFSVLLGLLRSHLPHTGLSDVAMEIGGVEEILPQDRGSGGGGSVPGTDSS